MWPTTEQPNMNTTTAEQNYKLTNFSSTCTHTSSRLHAQAPVTTQHTHVGQTIPTPGTYVGVWVCGCVGVFCCLSVHGCGCQELSVFKCAQM